MAKNTINKSITNAINRLKNAIYTAYGIDKSLKLSDGLKLKKKNKFKTYLVDLNKKDYGDDLNAKIHDSALLQPEKVYIIDIRDENKYSAINIDEFGDWIKELNSKNSHNDVDFSGEIWDYVYNGFERKGGLYRGRNGEVLYVSNLGYFVNSLSLPPDFDRDRTMFAASAQKNDYLTNLPTTGRFNEKFYCPDDEKLYGAIVKSFGLMTITPGVKNSGIYYTMMDYNPEEYKTKENKIVRCSAVVNDAGDILVKNHNNVDVELKDITIDHLDGNHNNNRADNLMVVTRSVNSSRAHTYTVVSYTVKYQIMDGINGVSFALGYNPNAGITMPMPLVNGNIIPFQDFKNNNNVWSVSTNIAINNGEDDIRWTFSTSVTDSKQKTPKIGNIVGADSANGSIELATAPIVVKNKEKSTRTGSVEEFSFYYRGADDNSLERIDMINNAIKASRDGYFKDAGFTVCYATNDSLYAEGTDGKTILKEVDTSGVRTDLLKRQNTQRQETLSSIIGEIKKYNTAYLSTVNYNGDAFIDINIDDNMLNLDAGIEGEKWYLPKYQYNGIFMEFDETSKVEVKQIPKEFEVVYHIDTLMVDPESPESWLKASKQSVSETPIKQKGNKVFPCYLSNAGRFAIVSGKEIKIKFFTFGKGYPEQKMKFGGKPARPGIHNLFASTFMQQAYWSTAYEYLDFSRGKKKQTTPAKILSSMVVHHRNTNTSMYSQYNLAWVSQYDNTFFDNGSGIAVIKCENGVETPVAAFPYYSGTKYGNNLKAKLKKGTITINFEKTKDSDTVFSIDLDELERQVDSSSKLVNAILALTNKTREVTTVNGNLTGIILRECVFRDTRRNKESENCQEMAKAIIAYRYDGGNSDEDTIEFWDKDNNIPFISTKREYYTTLATSKLLKNSEEIYGGLGNKVWKNSQFHNESKELIDKAKLLMEKLRYY